MSNENKALLYAPLVMPFVFASGVTVFDTEYAILNYLGSVLVIAIIGLPIVYTFEFFIGYRFYRLLLKKKKVNIFTLVSGCMLLANIPSLFIGLFGGYDTLSSVFPLFTLIGFSIGLAFWIILNWNRIIKKQIK